jgi:hypothetical protein
MALICEIGIAVRIVIITLWLESFGLAALIHFVCDSDPACQPPSATIALISSVTVQRGFGHLSPSSEEAEGRCRRKAAFNRTFEAANLR